jgi:hypothetical protein
MNLDDLLEKVNSKQTFIEFVAALENDRAEEVEKEKSKKSSPFGPGANGWQNGTIENFLDAAHAFAQDSPLISEIPDWKSFALILYAGKFYE